MSLTGAVPEGYLDASAGEPLDPAAREALLLAAEQGWADPSGSTPPARRARILLDSALAALGTIWGVAPRRIHPVHGDPGPIAVDQMLAQPFRSSTGASDRVLVVSAIEREPILRRALDTTARMIEVDSLGRIRIDQLAAVLEEVGSRAAVSLHAANGEVGTVQPIAQIAELARSHGATLHLDYQAAIGRVPLVDADYISTSASSWGGPRGVGLVIAGDRAPSAHLDSLQATVSIPLLLAAAAALEARTRDNGQEDERLRGLINQVRRTISAIPGADLAGDPDHCLPHLLTASFLYVDGQLLMDALAHHGLYIGSGSACIASRIEPSHVLTAMGRLSHGNIRLALAHGTRERDIERLISVLPGTIASLRAQAGIDAESLRQA